MKPRSVTEEDDSLGGKMDNLTEIFDKTTSKIIREQHDWRKLMTRKFDSVNDDVHAMKSELSLVSRDGSDKLEQT